MMEVNIKNLLGKMSDFATSVLYNAAGLSVSTTHYEVTVEHVLLKALEVGDSDIPLLFEECGIERSMVVTGLNHTLETMRTGNAGKPVFSPLLLELMREAWVAASVELNLPRVRTGAILLALVRMPGRYGAGEWIDRLSQCRTDAVLAALRKVGAFSCEKDITPTVRERTAQEPIARAGARTARDR